MWSMFMGALMLSLVVRYIFLEDLNRSSSDSVLQVTDFPNVRKNTIVFTVRKNSIVFGARRGRSSSSICSREKTPTNSSESDMEPSNTTNVSGDATLDTDSTKSTYAREVDEINITVTAMETVTMTEFPDVIGPPEEPAPEEPEGVSSTSGKDYSSTAEEDPEDSKTTRKPRPAPSSKKRTGSLDDSLGTWITDTIKKFSIIISVILILLAALLAYIFYVRSRKKVEKKRQLAYEEMKRRRRIPLKSDNADEKNKPLPIYLFDTEAKGIEGETDSRPPSGQRVVEIRAQGTDFANYRK
ncbi:hypothetical protein Aduo_006805 [Ancylostoma duodenale]